MIINSASFAFLLTGTPSTPIMPGGAPGTPSSKAKVSLALLKLISRLLHAVLDSRRKFINFDFAPQDKIMLRAKIVVALYSFRAIEGGDLSLEKVKTK